MTTTSTPHDTLPPLWETHQQLEREAEQHHPGESVRAAEKRIDRVWEKMSDIKHRIIATPASTIADALVKVRLAGYEIRVVKGDFYGEVQEEKLEYWERLTLDVCADIERLSDGGAS